MKTTTWMTMAVLALGLVAVRGTGGCMDDEEPDEHLASHLTSLCKIARGNIATPARGVTKLGRYVGRHADHMLGDLGGMLAAIERIDGDKAHDARARVARDRLHKPLRACERDWARFAQAVEADPEASARLDRGMRRLNRTLEIIFTPAEGTAAALTLRSLPARLEALVPAPR